MMVLKCVSLIVERFPSKMLKANIFFWSFKAVLSTESSLKVKLEFEYLAAIRNARQLEGLNPVNRQFIVYNSTSK